MTPLDQLESTRRSSLPPLEGGDHLTRSEFERRYAAMPKNVRAELIDGVVYMASPTKDAHGEFTLLIAGWLMQYAARTPGSQARDNVTIRLGGESDEPQPDALLKINEDRGGRSHVDADGYLAGPVELIVEVAATSASYDLHDKKHVYQRHGVAEYLVVVAYSREVHWFELAPSGYEPLRADKKGVLRSRVYPGLWLDTRALLAGDSAKLLATLDRGLASKEHATFARSLARRKPRGRKRR